MIYSVMAVKDVKADVWSAPYFARSTVDGQRMFESACADPQTFLHKFPDDFNLYLIGRWDDADCTFTFEDTPTLVGWAGRLKGSDQVSVTPAEIRRAFKGE